MVGVRPDGNTPWGDSWAVAWRALLASRLVILAAGALAAGLLGLDPRHTGFEIRDRRKVEERSFPDWSMELVRVKASYFEARDTIADRIPDSVPEAIQARLFRMTELISTIDFAN